MGRMYTVEFEGTTVANASGTVDLFEITPADDLPCTVHALFLSVSSELGDAAEEILRIRVIRGHVTSGSGGTATTPRPLVFGDSAAGFSAETLNTTIASTGTVNNLHSDGFNVRSGFPLVLTPEMRWGVTQANTTLVVRLMAAVSDDVTMSGTLYVEELG